MEQIPISTFRKMTNKEMREHPLIELLFEGEPIGYFSTKDSVVMIGDLHIRVQKMFKALEQKVRAGMPASTRAPVYRTDEAKIIEQPIE